MRQRCDPSITTTTFNASFFVVFRENDVFSVLETGNGPWLFQEQEEIRYSAGFTDRIIC